MRNEGGDPITGRQLGALALTAARVPIYGYCVRVSWLWVLLGSLILNLGCGLLLGCYKKSMAKKMNR